MALLLRKRAEAADLARRLEGNTALGDDSGCLNVARLLGDAAMLAGDGAAALTHYEQALDWAAKIRFRPEIALTRLAIAELLLDELRVQSSELKERAGPSELRTRNSELQREALAHLDFAIEELRAMKMQPSLERALRHKGLLQA